MPIWKAENVDKVILQPWCVVKTMGNKLFLVGEQVNGMDSGTARLSTMIEKMDYGTNDEGEFNNSLYFKTMSGRWYVCRGEPHINNSITYMLEQFERSSLDYEIILEQEFIEDIIANEEYQQEFAAFKKEIGK